MSERNTQGGDMTVRLFAPDGTVLFIGAVDIEDPSQFIKYDCMFNGPSRLQVNVTDLAARAPRQLTCSDEHPTTDMWHPDGHGPIHTTHPDHREEWKP